MVGVDGRKEMETMREEEERRIDRKGERETRVWEGIKDRKRERERRGEENGEEEGKREREVYKTYPTSIE